MALTFFNRHTVIFSSVEEVVFPKRHVHRGLTDTIIYVSDQQVLLNKQYQIFFLFADKCSQFALYISSLESNAKKENISDDSDYNTTKLISTSQLSIAREWRTINFTYCKQSLYYYVNNKWISEGSNIMKKLKLH